MGVARFRGDVLARVRQAAGFTQDALALEIGVSSGQRIWQWERGAEQPKPKFVPQLAKVLGVDPMALLDGDPERPTISALRLAAGLTRDEVWAAAQVTKMTYHRIDRGVGIRPLAPSVVHAIAQVIGVSEQDIVAAIDRARETGT